MNILGNKHRLSQRSIEKVDMNYLLEGKKANVFYSDPPWSDGNLRYWNTMRNKNTGTTETNVLSLKEMTNKVRDIIRNNVDGYVILETGNKAIDFQVEILKPVVHNIQIFDVFYKSGSVWKPNKILVSVTNPKYKFNLDLTGIKCDGFVLPDLILNHVAKEGDLVIDPFMGLCNTGMASIKNGMVFAGNEFNSSRYDKALKSLTRYFKKYDRA